MDKDIEKKAQKSMKCIMRDLEFLYDTGISVEWDDKTWEVANGFNITKDMTEDDKEEALQTVRSDYGLSWDYVNVIEENGHFDYFKYQISYGGPSEEIRFFVDYELKLYNVMFWYSDQFNEHGIKLIDKNLKIAKTVFDAFEEMGMVEFAYNKGTK